MPGPTARPDAAILTALYINDGLNISAIATRFGVAAATVHNWLADSGVPRRPSAATARNDISDEDIVRLYTQEQRTAAEIAAELGCSPSVVYFRLARRGVPRRARLPRHRVRPPDADLADLYVGRRLSLGQIARLHRVSRQAVWGWLVAAGIARRPPGASRVRWPPDAPVRLYLAGLSGPAIADQLGCAPATVYRYLAAAGVARRPITPRIRRTELAEALDRGLSAPAIAAVFGVSVSCVCRALARHGMMTATQAAKHRRAARPAHLVNRPP